jgi:hypothetical protein
MSHREATEICNRVQELPEVESALPAEWVWRDAIPEGVHFNLQWNLKDDSVQFVRQKRDLAKLGVRNLYLMPLETFALPEAEIAAFRDVVFPRLRAGA